jgi:predicted DCC family thiol-disulfide oxidoreductase YuxK
MERGAAESFADTVFYDGGCGLCHATVKFLVRRDRSGRFRYAPLGGSTFVAAFPEGIDPALAESMLVRSETGEILARSSAVAYLLRRLGGFWGFVGGALAIVPRPLRDLGYRCVASVRRKVFAAPQGACPVLPPELRARFLD